MKHETKNFLSMHRKFEGAISDYNMIEENDHIAVALSGGKDSAMLLRLMARKKILVTNNFKISSIFINQGFENDIEKENYLREYSESLGVPFYSATHDIAEVISERKEKPCYVCSRTRRMYIFKKAEEIGAAKVALGHHQDDFIETFFLNILYGHEISTMKPFNPFFDGKFTVIRPMLYIDERDVKAETHDWQIFPSLCPYDGETERGWVRERVKEFYKRDPQIKKNIFRSMFTPNNEYLLKKPSKRFYI